MSTKNITGYCEPLSLRAGETVRLMAQSHAPGTARLGVVRVECGDPGGKGPGLLVHEVTAALPDNIELEDRPLQPGSWAEVDLEGLEVVERLHFECCIMPTRPQGSQSIATWQFADGATLALRLEAGCAVLAYPGGSFSLRAQPLTRGRWYTIRFTLRAVADKVLLSTTLQPIAANGPGANHAEPARAVDGQDALTLAFGALQRLFFARSAQGDFYDGRLARPVLMLDDVQLRWDLAHEPHASKVFDSGPSGRHAELHQLPARGVTGPDWDGSAQSWQIKPAHYDAVHFHSDDLYDAGWPVSVAFDVPDDLPSGIYAFRLEQAGSDGVEVEYLPFFVRPGAGQPTQDVALLMPSCTYMAYANHRMLFEGADFVAARGSLPPAHAYIRDHRELGPSCYESHDDGSGVMFSSRRRPVMNLAPGADRWNFTPDTCLNAFLEHLGCGHDVIADEDLHTDGLSALAPYRVIVTGTHPEYWSTAMLDALQAWLAQGGRLMYLGGNGFYWRVAFSDDWPGAIELRRAEDGVRNWETEPGESYHAFGGEYGGLWRRLGRPPNATVGVGFAAQGFERAIGYRRTPEAADPRAAWIFAGVDTAEFGTSGLGGGAAGQEIDRFDSALGSPPHALVVATATDFYPDMIRTKEDFPAAMVPQDNDPLVRADVVFFETGGGGAVFSASSISWFGALARDGYSNDVAQITANVVRRFADPAPFDAPDE